MKILSRNKIAAMVAGTFLMAAGATPFIVQAAETEQVPAGQHQKAHKGMERPQVTPDQAAQHISDVFGIDKGTVLKYNTDGKSFRDIGKAAFLAKASGKSIQDVISLKTTTNTWKDVTTTLGITKEQMKAARQDMAADGLNKKIGLDKQVALNLLSQGYHARDIGMASELSKNTNKPLNEVLDMRKINNTWSDVATTLGVDQETFKKDNQALGFGSQHKGHRGHGGQFGPKGSLENK